MNFGVLVDHFHINKLIPINTLLLFRCLLEEIDEGRVEARVHQLVHVHHDHVVVRNAFYVFEQVVQKQLRRLHCIHFKPSVNGGVQIEILVQY